MFTTYKRGEIGNQEQNALFTPSILLTNQTTCNYANLLFTKVSNITSFWKTVLLYTHMYMNVDDGRSSVF